MCNIAHAIPPPCIDHGSDIKVRPAGKNNRFFVNSAYALLSENTQHVREDVWSKVWKLHVSERV
jgi:hypothetical protein